MVWDNGLADDLTTEGCFTKPIFCLKRFLLPILCSLYTFTAFAQWTAKTTGITNTLRGVYILNETSIFVVGEAFSPNNAPILKSTDGGNTWVQKNSGTPNPLRDIAFNTNNKGFACGLYGTLLKTTDAGNTWGTVPVNTDAGFRAIDFPSKEVGYVAGEGGVFLKTTDVGVNWDSLNTGITQDLLEIEFLNNDTGFATGSNGFSNGIIIRTYDGGATWQTVYTSTQAIPALAVLENNVVYAAGGTAPSGGHEFIIRSTDGGNSWQEVFTGPPGRAIRRCAFNSQIAGWFVDDAGYSIRTKNGGETWAQTQISPNGLNSIYFADSDTGYAVGALGKVFKYTPCSIPLVQLGEISGPDTLCFGSTAVFTITPVSGANSYKWQPPANATLVYDQGDTLVAITFGMNSGDISVFAQGDCDTSVATIHVNIIPPLQASGAITGPVNFCYGDTAQYSIKKIHNALSYVWNVPADASIIASDDTAITVALGTTSGTIEVVAAGSCDTISIQLSVIAHTNLAPISQMTGDTSVCLKGLSTYQIPPVPDAFSYDWMVPDGALIIYTEGDTLIVVQFDSTSGNVSVTANGYCDSVSASIAVNVSGNYLPIDTIYGPTVVCQGDPVTFSIAPVEGASSYVWTVPYNSSILSDQNDTMIVVAFGELSGQVTVAAGMDNCDAAVAHLEVSVIPSLKDPDDVVGVTSICSGDSALFSVSFVAGADNYIWQVPGGSTIIDNLGDTLITVIFGDTSGYVTFTASDMCDTVSSSLYVSIHPEVPPIQPIIGDTLVCAGDTVTYSIGTVSGIDYSWNVPPSVDIIASQGDTVITVTFGSNSADITVIAGSVCSVQDTTLHVKVLTPVAIPPISGDTLVCAGATATYTIASLPYVEYLWSIPDDAIITASQGDTTITVQFGSQSGSITATAQSVCTAQQTSLSVTVSTLTPITAVTGDTMVCNGDTASYSIGGLSGYSFEWIVPADASIVSGQGDTAITVVFGSMSDDIKVVATSECFVQDTFLSVTVVTDAPIQSISGDTVVCSGGTATYTIGAVDGVHYVWTIPFDATIVASQGDTSITVHFGNSSTGISVVATSPCTIQDTSLAVTVLQDVSFSGINGPGIVCSGDTATYSIAFADFYTYSWTVPGDAVIISTQGDTSITVVFGNTSGTISVLAQGFCNSQNAGLPVTVVEYPPVPVITFVDNNLVSSEPSGNQWYLNGTAIAGATSQIYTPLINGTYSVVVSYPPGCETASDTFVVLSVGINQQVAFINVIVSPNPFESFTTLKMADPFQLQNCTLYIQDIEGKVVNTMENLYGKSVKISRGSMPDGLYFYRLTDEKHNLLATGKLIVQ